MMVNMMSYVSKANQSLEYYGSREVRETQENLCEHIPSYSCLQNGFFTKKSYLVKIINICRKKWKGIRAHFVMWNVRFNFLVTAEVNLLTIPFWCVSCFDYRENCIDYGAKEQSKKEDTHCHNAGPVVDIHQSSLRWSHPL